MSDYEDGFFSDGNDSYIGDSSGRWVARVTPEQVTVVGRSRQNVIVKEFAAKLPALERTKDGNYERRPDRELAEVIVGWLNKNRPVIER